MIKRCPSHLLLFLFLGVSGAACTSIQGQPDVGGLQDMDASFNGSDTEIENPIDIQETGTSEADDGAIASDVTEPLTDTHVAPDADMAEAVGEAQVTPDADVAEPLADVHVMSDADVTETCEADLDTCDPPCDCGYACMDGDCVAFCDPPCPEGYECVGGLCEEVICNPPCPPEDTCVDGYCTCAPGCGESNDPDGYCQGACGPLGPCETCTCDMEHDICSPTTEVGFHCCLTYSDCDDDTECTTDYCPTPGAPCGYSAIPCTCCVPCSGPHQSLLQTSFEPDGPGPGFTASYDNTTRTG
jgi:hypothetical protein